MAIDDMQVRIAKRLTESGMDSFQAAVGSSFYTLGLLTALYHPEWAQAYHRSLSDRGASLETGVDMLVADIPVEYHDGD